MAIYEIENEQGQRIKFEWMGAEPPTETDMAEVFASAQQPPTAPEPVVNVPEWGREHPTAYGVVGAAYETAKPLLEPLGMAGGAVLGAPAGIAGGVAGGALGYAAGKNIQEAAGEMLGVQPPKGAVEQLKELPSEVATGAAYEMGGQAFGQVLAGTAKVLSRPINNLIKNTVKSGISKGIRPSIPEVGRTSTQRESYYKKAQEAVQGIIANKQNLQFTDDMGNVVKGELPKSLDDFSKAITQTKQIIFNQYDDIAKAAGDKGAVVSLQPITKDLDDIVRNKVLNDLNPEVVNYAKARIATLTSRGQYTASEAQEAITALNSSLQAFYKNPSYDTASKAHVDALIANRLRSSLDDAIEKTTGAGYQALKNVYGSLKTIEKDVTKRAIVDARKNVRGLVDFSDVMSGAAAVNGLINMNPATFASAVTSKGIASWIKSLNDPNKTVKFMFNRTENLMNKALKPKGETIKRVGEYGAKAVLTGQGE